MTEATTNPAEDLRLERVFDAPRETVFKAWLGPEQIAQWYGPAHFTVPQGRIIVEPQMAAAGSWC